MRGWCLPRKKSAADKPGLSYARRTSLVEDFEHVVFRFLVIHHRKLLDQVAVHLVIGFLAIELDEIVGVVLDKESIDNGTLDLGIVFRCIHLQKGGLGLFSAYASQGLNGSDSNLGIVGNARRFRQAFLVVVGYEAVDNGHLILGRVGRFEKLAKFFASTGCSQSFNRGTPNSGIALLLGGGKQLLAAATDDVRVENSVADAAVGGATVKVTERGYLFGRSLGSEIFDCLALQLGMSLSTDYIDKDLLGFRSVALRQHKQGMGLDLGTVGRVENPLDLGNGALRIAVHEAVEGQDLDFVVAVILRIDGPARGLANFDLEGIGIFEPGAFGMLLAQLANGCERFVSAAKPVQ